MRVDFEIAFADLKGDP